MGHTPGGNPLQNLFIELVDLHFDGTNALRDTEVKQYVAAMLTEFCDVENLFKVHNAEGRPLHDVGEMLLESDPVYGPAPSFDRERQVRKHIGDFTLFCAGMFPESINRHRLRRQRLEGFIDFVRAGKESYYIVSKFEEFEYKRVAPLFGKLSREFETCVLGLNGVKNTLLEMQHPLVRRPKQLIM